MIDHILGRPSQKLKRYQVFLVAFSWYLYTLLGPRHGPPGIESFSRWASRKRFSPWQIYVFTLTSYYVLKNIDKLMNLSPPQPLKSVYSRSYFRAMWIITAASAGFWTAMPIQSKYVRDIVSLLFTGYYLVFSEQAEEKAHKFRSALTVHHIRAANNISRNPYVGFLSGLMRPKNKTYRDFKIRRPRGSKYADPVDACMWFDRPLDVLKQQRKIILDIHGGGFVAMSPQEHADALAFWAKDTGLPVFAINYRKAPEYPYPYALDECFDAYLSIVRSRGICIGLAGDHVPEIVLVGDSAGGNLIAAMMLKILTNVSEKIKLPVGIIMVYPALELNFSGTLSEDQLRLISQESRDESNPGLYKRKTEVFNKLSGGVQPYSSVSSLKKKYANNIKKLSPKILEGGSSSSGLDSGINVASLDVIDSSTAATTPSSAHSSPNIMQMSLTSRMAYADDRLLSPEVLVLMVLLYVGVDSPSNISNDFFLSPLLAPSELLAKFPKVYLMCGEVDPLCDDTLIFAARLREAKRQENKRRQAMFGDPPLKDSDFVEVTILKGASHAFLQFSAFFPEAHKAFEKISHWIKESFGSCSDINEVKGDFHQSKRYGNPFYVDSDDSDSSLDSSYSGASSFGTSSSHHDSLGTNNEDEDTVAGPDSARGRARVKQDKSRSKWKSSWDSMYTVETKDVVNRRNFKVAKTIDGT